MDGQAVEKLFWGLAIEPGKQYKQTPKFNFHVSMAVLDLKSANDEPVSVYVKVENGEFILCNLNKQRPQANLDLIFSVGEKIKFYTVGAGSVHLTGYTMPEDDLGDMMEDEFSDEESVDSDLADLDLIKTNLNAKRKNTETLKLTGKDAKKLKTNDGKAVETVKQTQQPKIIDVDPKQLLAKKEGDKKPVVEQKKNAQQQQVKKDKANNSKLATKNLEVDDDDSEDDDDLSVDEDEESVDLNKMIGEADSEELDDDDLESDDDDLESDDDDDIAKLKAVKGNLNKSNNQQQGKAQFAGKKPQHQQNEKKLQFGGKPNQQKQQNGQFNNKVQFNKTPQNKSNQNTPNQHNKSQQKHQQTPFNNNKGGQSYKKGGSPFQHNKQGNKPFGSNNKSGKKVF